MLRIKLMLGSFVVVWLQGLAWLCYEFVIDPEKANNSLITSNSFVD